LYCVRESEKTEISEMTSTAEEIEDGKELFSVQLRKATKTIHDLSDALVNAKLGVTISDDSVWAEGLLVFYEVFKFLEKSLSAHSDSLIGDLLIPGMARTEAFEKDLDFFFGDWKESYEIRPEVRQYLDHLESLDHENPYLLIPYIYHLYMGLFSGGQILAAKRKYLTLSGNKNDETQPGCAVTSYPNKTIKQLKTQLRQAVNDLADNLDQELKQEILKESVKVFELNNVVIKSVKGVNQVLMKKAMKLLIAVLLILFFFFACYVYKSASEIEVEGDVFESTRQPFNDEL